jgi:hypothetical protein
VIFHQLISPENTAHFAQISSRPTDLSAGLLVINTNLLGIDEPVSADTIIILGEVRFFQCWFDIIPVPRPRILPVDRVVWFDVLFRFLFRYRPTFAGVSQHRKGCLFPGVDPGVGVVPPVGNAVDNAGEVVG